MIKHPDILGNALIDFHFNKINGNIIIHSPDFEQDEIPVSWYFRDYDAMPEIEKEALSFCKGSILDIGAGAGSHALYLQSKEFDVTGMDISEGGCRVMRDRGVRKVINSDVYTPNNNKYDTVLMMMNGIGITSSIQGLESFLDFVPGLLESSGQIIFDSSNLIYLYQDDHNVAEINLAGEYYGEIEFQMEYNGVFGKIFRWIYVDFDTISAMCEKRKLKIELLHEGENLQYLARILF